MNYVIFIKWYAVLLFEYYITFWQFPIKVIINNAKRYKKQKQKTHLGQRSLISPSVKVS